MRSSRAGRFLTLASMAISILCFMSLSRPIHAEDVKPSEETTNMVVVVTEASTGQPISQARITLQFFQPGGAGRLGKTKKLAYNAKTDAQGRCRLTEINKGTIILSVTADGHQSYGKELQLEKDNQVFEVKLKKPQPLM